VQPILVTLETICRLIAEIKAQLAHGGALLNVLYQHYETLGGYEDADLVCFYLFVCVCVLFFFFCIALGCFVFVIMML
jgi:hypothetical protein